MGCNCIFLGFTECCNVYKDVLGLVKFYRVLLSFTGFLLVFLRFTDCRLQLSFTRFYKVILFF